jgi:hypothetical protein
MAAARTIIAVIVMRSRIWAAVFTVMLLSLLLVILSHHDQKYRNLHLEPV